MAKIDGRLKLRLDDGEQIHSDLALTTVGAVSKRRRIRTRRAADRAGHPRGRIPADLRAGRLRLRRHCGARPNVRTGSILLAAEQGKGAAANAMATLTGRPLEPVARPQIPLSFKHANIEFYAVGVPAGSGSRRETPIQWGGMDLSLGGPGGRDPSWCANDRQPGGVSSVGRFAWTVRIMPLTRHRETSERLAARPESGINIY